MATDSSYDSKNMKNRREFLKLAAALGTASMALPSFAHATRRREGMRLGLCTYQWGRNWDLPAVLTNCEKTDILGVELRTQHEHGVEPSLNAAQRKEVKKRFQDSPVTLIGYGSNDEYHSTDPAEVRKNIEHTKALIHLMHDVGGTGVKVKPNGFPKGIPHEKTIEQIGKSLLSLGKYGEDYGQQIRLEVHGEETQELPNIKAIMDVANHRNVKVCWNCNDQDLIGKGLEYNFNLVKDRLGDTTHVREFNVGSYPYPKLMELLVREDYKGWVLLECRTEPSDLVAAMAKQRDLFTELVADAKSKS